MRKMIVLLLSIILPIIGSIAVGLYARNIWFNPERNATAQGLFKQDLLSDAIESDDKIDAYRLADLYKIEVEPVYLKDVLNSENEKVLTLAIYRSLRPFQPNAVDFPEPSWRVQYEVFVYDVNYDLIRDYFNVDDERLLISGDNPVLDINFESQNSTVENEKILYNTIGTVSSFVLADYGAVNEDKKVEGQESEIMLIGYTSFYNNYYVSTTNGIQGNNTTYQNFTDDANVKLEASITLASGTTISATESIFEFTFEDFILDAEELDQSKLVVANGASKVKDRLENSGYYGWLFKNYIWWISLVALGVFGLVTGFFYVTWVSEEKAHTTSKKTK